MSFFVVLQSWEFLWESQVPFYEKIRCYPLGRPIDIQWERHVVFCENNRSAPRSKIRWTSTNISSYIPWEIQVVSYGRFRGILSVDQVSNKKDSRVSLRKYRWPSIRRLLALQYSFFTKISWFSLREKVIFYEVMVEGSSLEWTCAPLKYCSLRRPDGHQ